jgi:hypothetical protein
VKQLHKGDRLGDYVVSNEPETPIFLYQSLDECWGVECHNFQWQLGQLLYGLHCLDTNYRHHMVDNVAPEWVWRDWIDALRKTIARMELL